MHIYLDYAEVQHYDRVYAPLQFDVIQALFETGT